MDETDILNLYTSQKKYFKTGATIPVAYRKNQLTRLKESISLHEAEVEEALAKDLGKSSKEAFMSEIGMVYAEIDYMLKHIDCLARSHCALTPLHEFPSWSKTIYIPYGTVLIMSPWNYPFNLTMVPLVDALAAGNTVILKPSNYSVATTDVIQKIISDAFGPEYVAVVPGNHEQIQMLLGQPFDYIFFTGGKTVGKIVMQKAAENLVPLTLELGGKSPAIVDETSNLALAAKRIVWGKFLNAGQTCVAPDYVYVQETVKDDFLALLKHEIAAQYPNPTRIGKIISQKHFDRLKGLVDPSKVVYGGMASEPTLQIAPTVMDNVTWDDAVMQEEIFGPILPVLTYRNFSDVMKEIQDKPTPLAFYLFTRDRARKAYYEKVQPFGSGCINDTVVQLSNEYLPFGGMGASGMGQYHGKYGFACFSHDKAILEKAGWLDLPMRYTNGPKFSDKLIRMILK